MSRWSAGDVEFMKRCLELAQKGALWVTPNPMVGCVIVKNGKIIAEAYHRRFGGPHAEVRALLKAGEVARGATMYVSLEPCSHFGKTPPCVDAIIRARIARVVAASRDPNPLVAGRGFRKLRDAGILVESGILAAEAQRVNERFFFWMRTGLPFVGLKLAQTLDGKIADVRGKSRWITGKPARREAHRLRAQYHAVLIGARTALLDDPQLTVRHVNGRNPVRVVVDGQLNVTARLKIFREGGQTIVVTTQRATRAKPKLVEQLRQGGAMIVALPGGNRIHPERILYALAQEGISSVLIEGGSDVVSQFLQNGYWNKLHLFIAPKILGEGISFFASGTRATLDTALDVKVTDVRFVPPDILLEGYPRYDGRK